MSFENNTEISIYQMRTDRQKLMCNSCQGILDNCNWDMSIDDFEGNAVVRKFRTTVAEGVTVSDYNSRYHNSEGEISRI